jgi:hypothetical protein
MIFLSPHPGDVGLFFVAKAAEVQHAVANDPQKFVIGTHAKSGGIVAHTVYAYIDLSVHAGSIRVGEIERNDIGERVVIEVTEVETEQEFVCAENIVQTYFADTGLVKTYTVV